MTTIAQRSLALLLGLVLTHGPLAASAAAQAVPAPPAIPAAPAAPGAPASSAYGPIGRTPPRLSYVNGEVSYWRPGAADWAPAQINTALAPGDETYTGNGGNLELQVGYSHPVRITPRQGIEFEVPAPTQVVVRGIDKQLVGQTAAEIRKVRPPEPYKGKGIRYEGEYVARKVGKRA